MEGSSCHSCRYLLHRGIPVHRAGHTADSQTEPQTEPMAEANWGWLAPVIIRIVLKPVVETVVKCATGPNCVRLILVVGTTVYKNVPKSGTPGSGSHKDKNINKCNQRNRSGC